MKKTNHLRNPLGKTIKKLVAVATICLILTPAVNLSVQAQTFNQLPAKVLATNEQISVPPQKSARTGPHHLTKIIPRLAFSANPTDLEIENARVFFEPLRPTSGAVQSNENAVLAKTLIGYKDKSTFDDISELTKFLAIQPSSRWNAAIKLNIGLICLKTGKLSHALSIWKTAWQETKNGRTDNDRTIANRIFARLVLLEARLGRTDELRSLLAEVENRPFFGSDSDMIDGAKQGLYAMDTNPACAYKCGPYALGSIIQVINPKLNQMVVQNAKSTKDGTNLAQVKDWSDQIGLNYQIAKRAHGAEIISPAVVHFKLGHFAAIVGRKNDRWIVKDPTFDSDSTYSVTSEVIDEETDGYSLIPNGPLKSGWTTVSSEDACQVWGKGGASQRAQRQTTRWAPSTPTTSCSSKASCNCGMASASIWSMQASLNIVDTPLTYSPPIGPNIDFRINYTDGETDQPSTPTFSNLGADWTINMLSYVTVDPGTQVATIRVRGGGVEISTPSGSIYPPDILSQAVFVSMGSGVYQRQLPDGSIEVFDQADGSGNIFMTKIIDAHGNSALIQYDSNFRITTITDAITQVSTFSYVSNTVGNSGFYKIASISDPFGRTATFAYDSTNSRLLSSTDSINLKSQFVYDPNSSLITSLSTPYGTTSFYSYIPGNNGFPAKGLRCTFPDGTYSVLENWLNEDKATYYWDRHATMLYPSDPANKVYTHCDYTKYVIGPSLLEYAIPQFTTKPLESKGTIFYQYPNQSPSPNFAGSSNRPTVISRAIGSQVNVATVGGTPAAGNVVSLSYFDVVLGSFTPSYTVQAGDTTQTIAKGLADQVNKNSKLQSVGAVAIPAGSSVTLHSDLQTLNTAKNSATGTTTLSVLSAVKQTAQITVAGTITTGDQPKLNVQLPTPLPNGTAHLLTYTVQAGDTYSSIAAGFAALINADSSLQANSVTATSSGASILVTSFSSIPQTFSQSGGSVTLTAIYGPSLNNQVYKNTYNSIGLVTQSVDPMGRTFSYQYDTNNIDLLQITETRDGDNYLIGAWTYNSHHRPLTYTDGSGQVTQYSYNSSQQLLTETDPNGKITTNTYTGTATATIGGTVTAGNTVTITVFDAGLAGGQKAKTYTVLAGDTLTTIATGLKNAINGDSSLSAIGVTATSSAAVITIKSNSVNVTTYTGGTSGGATETVVLGSNTFGYLTKIDGPLPGTADVTTFAYDTVGRISQTTDSEGYVIKYAYDNADRLTKTTYPDTTTEQTVYDKLDSVLTKDRIGQWSQSSYNSLDQIAYEIDPLGRKTQYTWCTCGSLSALTDPNGHTTYWQHDLQGRPIRKILPDNTSVNYTYEVFRSKLKQRTDALGQSTLYTYNPDDALYQTGYLNAINPTGAVTSAWDYNFRRLKSISKSDWGTISYTYNNYIAPGGTAITGGGQIQKIHNDVISNSDITYQYDPLTRITNRSINGTSNSINWSYDEMSRVTAESNALGNFSYAYLDNVAGSSKGTTRLSSVTYPNSQVTNFNWYPNLADQRLQQIQNLSPTASVLSRFAYSYDPSGQIIQGQQRQNNSNTFYNYGYDAAGQLISAQGGSGSPTTAYSNENYYSYDPSANRTSEQRSSLQTLRIGGTVTAGNTISVTVQDPALSAPEVITYTVLASDTLAKIAAALATAINTNVNLQTLGVSANAHGTSTFVNIKSASSNITTYTASTSGGATETANFGIFKNGLENATIGGTITAGNIVTLTIYDPGLSGGAKSLNYTVVAGNTTTSIATSLKNLINADTALQAIGVTATSVNAVVSISSVSINPTTYSSSLSAGSTLTISLVANNNPIQLALIGGTKTTGDILSITVYDAGLSGGLQTISYTVLAADTLATIATALTTALNGNSQLQTNGISATSNGTVITIQSNSPNATSYRQSTNSTESILFTTPKYSWQVVNIGGTKTTGNILTINVLDALLAGGKETVNYTVLAGDTLTSITSGLASTINANTNLQAIGVSATASSTVLSIESLSPDSTTYTTAKSTGSTETMTQTSAYSIRQSTYNSVDELVSITGGGSARFQASTDKPAKSATVTTQVLKLQAARPADETSFSTAVTRTPTETLTFAFIPGYNFNGDGISITVGGTPTAGDVLKITFWDDRLAAGSETISYTVTATDTLNSIASNFISIVSNDATLFALRYSSSITSLSGGTFIVATTYVNPDLSNATVEPIVGVTSSITSTGSEIVSTSENADFTISGTITTGDKVSMTVSNNNLPFGEETVSYTVAGGDTATNVATGLKNAINANANLQAMSLIAVSLGPTVTALAYTNYTTSTSGGSTETLSIGLQNRGNTTITVGGVPKTGDVLTITALNGLLPGGQKAISYTVLATDTLVSIAAALASAYNADTSLQGLGAKIDNFGQLSWSQSFLADQLLPIGTSSALVSAVDGSSNVKTNSYTLSVNGGSTASLTFDLNGNMTSDGLNTYTWDAENRMIKISYPGVNNFSTFGYDQFDRNVNITETVAGSVTSQKQFVWISEERGEERNGTGALTKMFFERGQTISGSNYFYELDSLGSVSEMTDASVNIKANYLYDPFGNTQTNLETVASDFGFAGYYKHARSGLNLTWFRSYSPKLGRWISRDPFENELERYTYVLNNPAQLIDPTGLFAASGGGGVNRKPPNRNPDFCNDCVTDDCCDSNRKKCEDKCKQKYKKDKALVARCKACCGDIWSLCIKSTDKGDVFESAAWKRCFEGTAPPRKTPPKSGSGGAAAGGGGTPPPDNTRNKPPDNNLWFRRTRIPPYAGGNPELN